MPRNQGTVERIDARGSKSAIEAQDARLASTLDLKDLSDREGAFLATCQKIYRRDFGCVTPFEEFFWSLVINVEDDRWPTPDDVARELAIFRENFEDMDKWARVFVASYPTPTQSTVTAEPSAAPEGAPIRKGFMGQPRPPKSRKAATRA